MPYVTRCRSCGRHPQRGCKQCAGSGTVDPYRTQISIVDAQREHGWPAINGWDFSAYQTPGKCFSCGKTLTGRKKVWCGDRLCQQKQWKRFYEGIHWTKRHLIIERGCACQSCGEVFEKPMYEGGIPAPWPRKLEVDHIIPLILGGTERVENLQLLCVHCHRRKTASEGSAFSRVRQAPGGEPCGS